MEPVKLLICEDEGLVALDLSRRLTNLGYHVVGTAPEGEQAFALAERHRPDCILMDIQLAGGSPGTEVAAIINQELDIPSIYLTAYSDFETIKKAEVASPVGYLVKPVNDRDLNIAIRIGLAQHKARAKLKKDLEASVSQVKDVHTQLAEVSSKVKNSSGLGSLHEIMNGICHHFNNSLQGLVGALDLLERQGTLPPAQLETVRCSMRVCESHENFIRRLTWASGRANLKLKPCNIQEITKNCIDEMSDSLPRNIQISHELGKKPIDLRVDIDAMQHAIRALIANSIEASARSGIISVKLEEVLQEAPEKFNPAATPDWFCVITIKDNGSGILPEHIERVTEPFFSTRVNRVASGLGLTEAYGIAMAHRGWLNIESEHERGTAIKIFLPLERPLSAVLS